MTDITTFDPNKAANPNNNIFGLPFTEEDAKVIILPIPWEVTVSYNAGTARSAEHIFKASLQVDLYDPDVKDGWKEGFYMRKQDKKVLLKSDYLRKEAELYIDYISKGDEVSVARALWRELSEGAGRPSSADVRAHRNGHVAEPEPRRLGDRTDAGGETR
jgi:agmatinase